MAGFFYSIDEPKISGARIVVEQAGIPVAVTRTKPYPAGGEYKLTLPAPGQYRLVVTKDNGPELAGSLSVTGGPGALCRQIVTYTDSLQRPFLAVLDCRWPGGGMQYAVQVGAFRERTAEQVRAAFAARGLHDVNAVEKNGFSAYVTGRFDDFYSALALRRDLIEMGLHDAFVVALADGRFVPLEQAVLALQ
jgi:hypothetical protein